MDITEKHNAADACISMYYFDISNAVASGCEPQIASIFNEFDREYLRSLTNPVVRRRTLTGRLMLQHIAVGLGLDPLKHYSIAATGKPYLLKDNCGVSISHSGDMVVCAFVHNAHLGVDVERIRKRSFADLKNYFTDKEWLYIQSSGDEERAFFQMWTRKESAIKADGRGLAIPLASFDCSSSECQIDGRHWHFQEVLLHTNYVCSLACEVLLPVKLIDFSAILGGKHI